MYYKLEGFDTEHYYGTFRRGELLDFLDEYFSGGAWTRSEGLVFAPSGIPAFFITKTDRPNEDNDD